MSASNYNIRAISSLVYHWSLYIVSYAKVKIFYPEKVFSVCCEIWGLAYGGRLDPIITGINPNNGLKNQQGPVLNHLYFVAHVFADLVNSQMIFMKFHKHFL